MFILTDYKIIFSELVQIFANLFQTTGRMFSKIPMILTTGFHFIFVCFCTVWVFYCFNFNEFY